MRRVVVVLLSALCVLGAACESPERIFHFKFSNVTAFQFAKSGAGATILGPGDHYEVTFSAGDAHRLSLVTMLGESNDWFFGLPPEGVALYDNGAPVTGDLTSQVSLYNAGTEVDEEPGVGPDTLPKQSAAGQGAADADRNVRVLTNPVSLSDGHALSLPAIGGIIQVTLATTATPREFKLTVKNVSSASTLQTSQGAMAVHLSRVAYVVHTSPNPLFEVGHPDRGQGLEQLAEDGNPAPLVAFLAPKTGVVSALSPLMLIVHSSGKPLFSSGEGDRGQGLEQLAESGDVEPLLKSISTRMPQGASSYVIAGPPDDGMAQPSSGVTPLQSILPIQPGQDYVFDVVAKPGDRFSFASMLGASNDWFVGVADEGAPLFDSKGHPLTGDFSSALTLWNAGTEVDEEPGIGADTGPNQSAPNQGAPDSVNQVRPVDSSLYPTPVTQHASLTVTE